LQPDFRQPSFYGLIGIAREEITPPIGIYARNWAVSEHDVAVDVHRPLTATVLTLRTKRNEEPLILISLDLGWWRRKEDEWFVRGYVIEHLNVDPSRVIIALTHTHSGPSISLGDADKEGGNLVRPYLQLLRDNLVQLVRQASQSAVPATLAWTYGRCRLAKNRDQFDPELGAFVNGYDERSPADPVLLVGKIIADSGETIGSIVNYACHPTSIGWETRVISPDYVGAMRELVEDHHGGICMFLQGAGGEMAPRDQYSQDVAVADRNGRELGYAVLSALESMVPPGKRSAYLQAIQSGAVLGIWETVADKVPSHCESTIYTVEVPLKPMPSVEQIDEQIGSVDDRAMIERLRREREVRHAVGSDETVRFPIWLWAAGDALILGCPAEPYSLLQRHLRLHFIDRAVCVINIANGWYGYLPPRELYDKPVPSVLQTPFAKGSLEYLIHGSLTQFERLCKQSHATT
jgi:hypothetical protein